MTKGVRDLRMIEIGFQDDFIPPAAGWDTCVVPTERLVGICGMKKIVNRVFPTEATGLMSSHIKERYYDPWIMAELPITTGEEGLTFQQLPWYLNMGAVGVLNGTNGLWTFTPALTAADMPYPATIRYGDNALAWESCCCFARQLVISGAFQGPWNMDADIVGRDMKIHAFESPLLAYPTPLETILGQMTVLNQDGTGCAFEDLTQVEGSLIDWTITIPGFHAKFFQDGIATFSIMGLASRHLTFEATVEWDSTWAAAEHAIWATSHLTTPASVPRYFQLVATGSTPAAPPPTAGALDVTINMVLMYESFETLEERDGNDIIKFTARTVYDVDCKDAGIPEWQIIVNNTETTLP